MQLILSARAPLRQRYGDRGLERVRTGLAEHRRNLARRGIPSHVIWLDSRSRAGRRGSDEGPGSWLECRDAARELSVRDGIAPSDVKSVFIVGGGRTVPFGRTPNPVSLRQFDPDRAVLTDNGYGELESSGQARWHDVPLAPDTPVGRLPEPSGASVDAFVERLRAAGRAPVRRGVGTFAFINREWRAESEDVVRGLPRPLVLREAPGHRLTGENAHEVSGRFLYFNLHGFADREGWYGFDPWKSKYTEAVAPTALGSAAVGGGTIFSEVCYGAVTEDRTSSDCCALASLRGGTTAFVGPTGLAFGSHVAPRTFLGQAGRLAKMFFEGCSEKPVGEALATARSKYLRDVGSSLTDFDRKTLLQFVLLGDPSRRAA